MAEPLFTVRGLRLALPDLGARPLLGPAPKIEILKGLDFDLPRGTVTGIVGESGSGKSTLGRCLVRLHRPTAGSIRFDGTEIATLDTAGLKPLRRDLQMVFQDPMSSLNPRHRVRRIVGDPLRVNGLDRVEARVAEALDRVHLGRAYADRYPHQLSGGQRQRVGIARALALAPRFILADEIVSGLDVSTQAQIIALLEEIVAGGDLTVAFISHDLSVIRRLCSHVMVMQAGEIVEQGATDRLFAAPGHPYTRVLLDAIPLPEPDPGWLHAESLDRGARLS
jgi:peptide/nickel transport system ATP-binding protein